jgi:hypothetical protein
LEAGAVVGQDAPWLHAQRAEVGNGVAQELRRARFLLVGIHVGEADARVVVDRHKQILPTGLDRVVGTAREALAHALDSPKLLGVEMDEIARPLVLVANDRLRGLQIAQSRETGPL